MSITHNLKIKTGKTNEDIKKLLLEKQIGLRPGNYENLIGEAVEIYFNGVGDSGRKLLLNEYGLDVNQGIYFRMDTHEDWDEGHRIVGCAVSLILKAEAGDAILFAATDTAVLKRIGGHISVKKDADEDWLMTALEKEKINYELLEELQFEAQAA